MKNDDVSPTVGSASSRATRDAAVEELHYMRHELRIPLQPKSAPV